MPKHLVIVESPAKAKTIAHYLGRDYAVKASVGHVRDLPQRSLGVDIEQGFTPTYQVAEAKVERVREIAKAASSSELVYLATDPDREGEAIAWHIAEAAHLEPARTRRIAFHQVTREAVQEALAHPRDLDRDLIDAQQARRVLDRLVGYKISPLLSRAIRKKALSAGRVQSVALRLVVEREREILAFIPEEYWTLDADLRRRTPQRERFRAHLHKIAGQDPALSTQSEVERILQVLTEATYVVTGVRSGQRKRQPRPPFITSTLQSEASTRLHFSPRQTMRLAQQLYEGIELDGEMVGLITYMRTDSTHIASEAQQEARDYVRQHWGEGHLPSRAPSYRSKVANAQEAHEAIRPTSVWRTPDVVRERLSAEQSRLYELIWRRFLASQMVPALYDTCSVDITAARDYLFRASGQTLVFAGYLVVYEDEEEKAQDAHLLSRLAEGEVVDLERLLPEQHFTEPPPRYSEATLIQALEANGVGRPSTYAAIISVIQDRNYVNKERGKLAPTPLGMVVCDVLVATFAKIMDVHYTAGMEEQLDRVASGELGYLPMLNGFYSGFSEEVEKAKREMGDVVKHALAGGLAEEITRRDCALCGRPMEVRLGARGRFLACSGYPECRHTIDLESSAPAETEVYAEEPCDKCGGRMRVLTKGKSRFLGCENYPRCKNTRPILSDEIKALAQTTACPSCGQSLEPRSGRYGEYLHCPACQVNHSLRKLGLAAANKGKTGPAQPAEIVEIACPSCGHKPLEKRQGRYGPYYRCPACKKNHAEKKLLGQDAEK